MEKTHDLGTKLKGIREQRELSVEQLAQMSQVAPEMIEELEKGLLAPSLAPLLKLARALGVRLGTFLDDAPKSEPVVVKSGKTDHVMRFSGDKGPADKSTLDFFSLGAEKKDRHMEPFLINVKPKDAEGEKLSSHEGEEFIYILKGQIEVCYGKENYTLEAGDSIYYDSVIPHYVHAQGDGEAQILAVVYTPV